MKSFISLLLLATLWPVRVSACRCQEPSPQSAYAHADAVAMVRVEEVSNLPDEVSLAGVDVLQAWKSELPKALSIFTGEDCAYPLKKGRTYLLYLRRSKEGEFGTYRCRGNRSQAASVDRVRWLNRFGRVSTILANVAAPGL